MAGIEIIAVDGRSELKDFIDLPWRIYAEYPNWVPPLKKEVRRMLDPRRHPFWEFSERMLFLARRGSETVGRIAGIIDRNYNQFHNEKMGIWGFFECADDPEAAAALFSSVETWALRKGMIFLRGPLSPSMNYETGLLIEGFDYPPVVGMTYNPPYYLKLIESGGYTKEKDLLAFLIDGEYRLPGWMDRLAERTAQKKGVR
ncbi:MAG TPA: acyl-CoA N-acyltransferase, partial [Nitrospirota bacterium]|nr:acyl-CoA N-acyltransferase [Nitrospirota bacterium]